MNPGIIRTQNRSRALHGLVLACSTGLAACATLPPGTALVGPAAADQYASERSFAAPEGQWPAESWWTAYGDFQLNQLVDEALRGSPSIAAAAARLHRAEAMAVVSGAALDPQISAEASANEQRQSYNYLSPRAVTPHGWNDYGRATLDMSWDLDAWGRNRAALAAATTDAVAARADAAQARLLLSAAIASAYAELAHQHAALDTARAALELRRRTAELFSQRRDHGLETLGSVRQVESRRAAAEADVLANQEQIALQRNRIAALLGAGPDRGLAIARPSVDLARPFSLPSQLAAGLLGRRPDIIAARLRAEAFAQRIHAARAAFYPDVNLLAFVGLQSIKLNMLTRSGSTVGSAGPAVSLPIFDGDRLRGQLRGAEADYAEAVADYNHTVVQALQDVADAATSSQALEGQIARTAEAVDAAHEAWRIQNNRYQGGLSTYLDVLAAEDNLLSSKRVQTDLQSRAFTLDVAMKRALGGGYTSTATTTND